MQDDMRKNRFVGIRVEVTVYTEKFVDGRQLYSGLDFLHLGGIKRTLGGSFNTKGILRRWHKRFMGKMHMRHAFALRML